MNTHRRQRLSSLLEAEGLDAMIATTTENVYYVTGLRSISHALFRGLELYGVFTRRGTGLVIPYIDTTGVAADGIAVDHLACYGKFFFEYAADPGEIGEKIRRVDARARRESRPTRWPACWAISACWAAASASTRADLFPATWQRLEERLRGTTIVPAYQIFRAGTQREGPRRGRAPRARRADRRGRDRRRALDAEGRA